MYGTCGRIDNKADFDLTWLSPAERNYDIGNRELLAIKLALEEWRHWLEGAQHPFTVITDHKNLEYLRSAKRLKPRQARWALFFTRFQFSLSRVHAPDEPSTPEPILPPAVLVSPIWWALDEQIRIASLTEPAPLGGPEGKTYVPTSLRTSLLGSLHASPGSGHPGSQRTLSLLQARYWWPSMAQDVSQYVRGCSVCAISNSTSLTRRKVSSITHSTSPLVPRRSRLRHRSPQVRRLYLHTRCSWQILQSLQVNSPPRVTHSPWNSRGPLS